MADKDDKFNPSQGGIRRRDRVGSDCCGAALCDAHQEGEEGQGIAAADRLSA
jgi:hypothetical protein